MSTQLAIYDEIACRKDLTISAKVLYADICRVTSEYQDRCYKFRSRNGAKRMLMSRNTWIRARDLLVEKGLVRRDGYVLVPLINGSKVSRSEHLAKMKMGAVPIILHTAHKYDLMTGLLDGFLMINESPPSISFIAKKLGVSRSTVYKVSSRMNSN